MLFIKTFVEKYSVPVPKNKRTELGSGLEGITRKEPESVSVLGGAWSQEGTTQKGEGETCQREGTLGDLVVKEKK